MKYNNYAERIIPIMLEHQLILNEEKDSMLEFIRDISGDEFA